MVLALLGDSRGKILKHLKERGTSTIPEMAQELGLNVETVRAHLRVLSEEGLARRVGSRRGGRGRPEGRFGLSERAQTLFPNREGKLLLEIIPFLRKRGESELLEAFFQHHMESRREAGLARVEGLRGKDRVEEVARILGEDGFLADTRQDEEGRPVLCLFHCPIRELVSVDPSLCEHEIGLVRALLGDQLRRVGHIPAGDPACCYAGIDCT